MLNTFFSLADNETNTWKIHLNKAEQIIKLGFYLRLQNTENFALSASSTEQQGKGGDHLLFHSTTSTHLRTFRYLFTTLLFTRLLLDKIYHLVGLPFDWLIDDDADFCLFTCWFNSRFLLQQFDTGNQWTWSNNYLPCITSEPINQVCWLPYCDFNWCSLFIKCFCYGMLLALKRVLMVKTTLFQIHIPNTPQ